MQLIVEVGRYQILMIVINIAINCSYCAPYLVASDEFYIKFRANDFVSALWPRLRISKVNKNLTEFSNLKLLNLTFFNNVNFKN